ncbi:hypothetical protein K1T71_003198 [Dendrolimus kikuchii]|uniref:Uncharacterized protein n=1 Tax=Dendrolimus kikuchii TaxID=765133 RepID=A0ACC1DB09_9NEOP|nr:hypothetical protein K1T71_003198 [Dendrolimus kikuchii]
MLTKEITNNNGTIKLGDFIVIQKQNFRKLHKFNKLDSIVTLGKDSINLNGIQGCKYFSIFKTVYKSNSKNKVLTVELVDVVVRLKDEIDVKTSGNDNRHILDDGNSQKLTAADIEILKNDACKASDIVETLITNSNTFHSKTEFSQDKYLKKKEKKYFEYIQILKPTLRTVAEIMYKLEPGKINHLRLDTLSQIITFANVSSEGNHLLYDSGSNGLLAAALVSAIGQNTNGKLLHMHPGNMSQKQALLAMNFSKEQLDRCVSVNVYSTLRQFYQGCDRNIIKDTKEDDTSENLDKRKSTETMLEPECKRAKMDEDLQSDLENSINPALIEDMSKQTENKKPKWHFDNLAASQLLSSKMDSLIIACKEDPHNIFYELMAFVKPGRPFVIYFNVAEPLQQLYTSLKSQSNVAALRLTCNWLRNYQILPDRTHPEVMMNGASGFLLSGYILK